MLKQEVGIERWDALIDLLERHFGSGVNLIGAEVGVNKGETAEKLLEHFPTLFLHCIDMWSGEWSYAYEAWLPIKGRYIDRIKEHRIPSDEAIIKDRLDFVFIDADHTTNGCYNDIVYYYPKVKKNGIVCGHDLAATIQVSGHPFSVQMAVMKYFQNRYHTAYGNIWYHIK